VEVHLRDQSTYSAYARFTFSQPTSPKTPLRTSNMNNFYNESEVAATALGMAFGLFFFFFFPPVRIFPTVSVMIIVIVISYFAKSLLLKDTDKKNDIESNNSTSKRLVLLLDSVGSFLTGSLLSCALMATFGLVK
jgi:hypothetical protein